MPRRLRKRRHTLLVRRGNVLQRDLGIASMKGLAFASAARPQSHLALDDTEVCQFVLLNGNTVGLRLGITKAAMMVLSDQYPQPMPFDALVDAARVRLQQSPAELARRAAEQAEPGDAITVINLRMEPVVIDAIAVQFLKLLDGKHDRAAILDAVEPFFAEDRVRILRDGAPVTDPIMRRGILVTRLDAQLRQFRRVGLLCR